MAAPRQKGVIAAGHRLTAQAGSQVLREGGNAFDAAIAALAMSCLCEPVLSSPGGGGFAMLRDGRTGKITLLDFFPQTPLDKRQEAGIGVEEIVADFGTATQTFHIGPATSATPGFFAGLEAIHRAGSTMPMADLFAPAIGAARTGIEITPYQSWLSNVVKPILVATSGAENLFAPGGMVPQAGAIFTNPGLADALGIMGHNGFYNSEIAKAVIDEQQDNGHLSRQDLEGFQVTEREPLNIAADCSTIHLNPLPAASGVLIAHSLAQIDNPDLLVTAKSLLATGRARRDAKNDLSKMLQTPLRQKGTTHISIIDAQGNACAVTVSNGEGNGELVGNFGFMLNNILGEEDVNPHGTSDWPTNIRLSSMMCPAIIENPDGALVALGSGGSNRIRSAMLQVIIHHCLEGMSLDEAIHAPRLHVEGGHLDFEDFLTKEARSGLTKNFPDHRAWNKPNMFFGGVHAARMDSQGHFTGTGDTRRDGVVEIVD